MLAIDVNDNACFLNQRAALESIASKLAPTGGGCSLQKIAACGSSYTGIACIRCFMGEPARLKLAWNVLYTLYTSRVVTADHRPAKARDG
ncbi:hypothetical protein PS723_05301 [Pseudomonas fluorescens]|uniref:Uncharacterized protein n=1 Tax=Pseudomonas fluorescens TaxID=294 RepID=A0A5E7F7M6_PSEFL|nr:hypothetical protein PS723_05301 [Pseudomonas fluorescens]